jgi:hypothetical protein
MKFLRAKNKNLPQTLRIIEEAQAYLATQHVEQWQN